MYALKVMSACYRAPGVTLSQDVNNCHVCRLVTVIVNIYLHYRRVYTVIVKLFALQSCT